MYHLMIPTRGFHQPLTHKEAFVDSYIGTIVLAGFNYAPVNWAFCNGQLLPINQNTALFSLLGNTYGGDGQTNFALPNLNAASLQSGLNYIICVNWSLILLVPSRAHSGFAIRTGRRLYRAGSFSMEPVTADTERSGKLPDSLSA